MCTGWPTTALPKPSFLSERAFSRSMVVMWWLVLMWLVAGWDPKFCGWLWDDARWGNVVSCEMSCHVMWSDAISCVVWCHVMSRDALRCHEMSSYVMICHLLRSHAAQWDEILWVCDAMCLVAMSRRVVRVVVSFYEAEDELLIRTTKYCKYYTVLQGTTKYYSVLQDTTKYDSSTRQYYSVPQSTTLYYKVLPRTPRHSDTVVPKPKISM